MAGLCECLLIAETRDEICRGIAQSLRALGMDSDEYESICGMLTTGTPIQKNYLILFGLVRLSGLYEMILPHCGTHEKRLLDTLYDELRDHLQGMDSKGTDAWAFAESYTVRAGWCRLPRTHN